MFTIVNIHVELIACGADSCGALEAWKFEKTYSVPNISRTEKLNKLIISTWYWYLYTSRLYGIPLQSTITLKTDAFLVWGWGRKNSNNFLLFPYSQNPNPQAYNFFSPYLPTSVLLEPLISRARLSKPTQLSLPFAPSFPTRRRQQEVSGLIFSAISEGNVFSFITTILRLSPSEI